MLFFENVKIPLDVKNPWLDVENPWLDVENPWVDVEDPGRWMLKTLAHKAKYNKIE